MLRIFMLRRAGSMLRILCYAGTRDEGREMGEEISGIYNSLHKMKTKGKDRCHDYEKTTHPANFANLVHWNLR